MPSRKDRITKNNPTGQQQQCDKREMHRPHEYQPEFGSYYDVYCPGIKDEKLEKWLNEECFKSQTTAWSTPDPEEAFENRIRARVLREVLKQL